MSPVSVLIRPTCPDCSVKNRLTVRLSRMGVCGPRAPVSLMGSSSTLPVRGFLVHCLGVLIENADPTLLNAGLPDVSFRVLGKSVGLGIGRQIEFANLAGPWVEPAKLAGELARPPDRSVSCRM